MNKKISCALLICITVFLYSPAFSYTGGPVQMQENSPSLSYESGEYYLTIPEVGISDAYYWVKWKLDLSNGNWQIIDYGDPLAETGSRRASGTYVYNSQRGVLIMEVEKSNFFCQGPGVETDVWFVASIFSTSMTWLDPYSSQTGQFILTRLRGSSGDITGTWNMTRSSGSYEITFNTDGTFSVNGSIISCRN